MTDKVVIDGYIKLLALSVSHLMTEIIHNEENKNSQIESPVLRNFEVI